MIYYLSKYIALFLLSIFFRFKVSGRQFFPKDSPCLIVSNHASYLDPIVIGCACPRRVYFVAKEELFRHPLANFFLRQLGAFPLKRNEADRNAVKKIFSLLKEKKVVCLFPEGTRNEGEIGDFRSGAIKLLMRSGAEVVVAGITGTYQSFPRGAKFPRVYPIRVAFSKPIPQSNLSQSEWEKILKNKMEEFIHAVDR